MDVLKGKLIIHVGTLNAINKGNITRWDIAFSAELFIQSS